ncbi:MAG: helix-turn-helix domain-containing protein [Euryarchaeota archaeon]|nr:helix-turn-helix domain-containing protein [Euryarchaeota archaeon]
MRPGLLVLLVFAGFVAAFMLVALPADAAPSLDAGGDPRVQLVASVDIATEIVRSGGVLPFRVRVVDHFAAPVAGATVTVEASGGVVTPASALTDANGLARFTFTAKVEQAQEMVLLVSVQFEDAFPDEAQQTVIVIPPLPQRPIYARPEAAAGAGIGAAILAAIASTEFGRYGLFNVVVFPLYSRLKKEEVLDHFVRGQIYGYIMSHPGEHYNSLRETLKVTNGTLAHHLRTLEMQGFVKSLRDGIYKRFYPVEMQIPRHKGIRLSDLQHHMLALIRSNHGRTQQEIADNLGVTQQTVSYNLRHLNREGLIRMEKDGRAKRYFPMDT